MKTNFVASRSSILKIYREQLPLHQQRRLISHFLNIIFPTISLVMQLVWASRIIFLAEPISTVGLKFLRGAITLLGGLYIFELPYNTKLELDIIAHHIITILCFLVAVFLGDKVQQPQVFSLIVGILIFHQTLNQPTHIAAILRRFLVSPVPHPTLRKYSAYFLVFATV